MKRILALCTIMALLFAGCASADKEMYETFTATAQEIEAYDAEWQKNAMTQLDLNTFSQTSYIKWDTLLNDIYQYLEKALPADEFEVLESEQIQWIKEKEEAIENATNEWSGGSGEAMVHFGTAAEYTKDRCYYLLTYISN